METQLIIRIDKGTKQKFSKIARTEGKTASAKVRELVTSYIEQNDFSRVVVTVHLCLLLHVTHRLQLIKSFLERS